MSKNKQQISPAAIHFTRLALALIYIWFGILKPMGLSPAAELVSATLPWFDPHTTVFVIGTWEVIIGLCYLTKQTLKPAIIMTFLHLLGIFSPLILVPSMMYSAPFVFTLGGQYVVKNLLIAACAWLLWENEKTN